MSRRKEQEREREKARRDRKRLDAEVVWEHKTGEEEGGGETDALCGTPDETGLSHCPSHFPSSHKTLPPRDTWDDLSVTALSHHH